MDLASLHTFITIAELGSFSLAGEKLHITQPAVSKRLAALEEQLLPRAYRIVNELEDSKRALQNLSDNVSGTLSLATSHHIGLRRLPPVLRRFTRDFPQVVLDIRFLDSEVAYNDVLHGRCELALITLSPQRRDPLRSVSLQDLCNWPAVFPGSQTFTSGIALSLFAAAGLTPNISMHTNYMETIKMMVSIGLAWSVLPHTMVDEEVCTLQVATATLSRDLGYILHRERTLSNAARAFIDSLPQAD